MNKTIKAVGYTPLPHQLRVHDLMESYNRDSIIVVKAKRQVGKSLLINNELLKTALTKPRSTSLSISPVMGQSRKQYTDLKEAVITSGLLKRANDSRLEMTFINNSKIFFLSSAMKDSLRGKTVERGGILVIDEAAFVDDDSFYILLPIVDVHKANILMVSTPFAKQGFFYEYWTRAMAGEKNIYGVDVNKYDTSMLLSAEKLEKYRETVPKNKFLTEYLGEFMDSQSMLFGDFKSLLVDTPPTFQSLYCGIDYGTGQGQDYTAISLVNENSQQVALFYFNDINSADQPKHIVKLLSPYINFIKKITAEKNSIGVVYNDILQKELSRVGYKGAFEQFITTNKSKNEIVERLQVKIQKKDITLLNDPQQILQLSLYGATVNKHNNVTYSAPSGFHDDIVMALMLSLTTTKGSYSII